MEADSIVQTVLFSFLLMSASVWNFRKRIIPESIYILIVLTGLIDFGPVKLLGIFAALPLLIAALCKPGNIGVGDIKLTAAAGVVLRFWGCMTGLILGLMASLVFYLMENGMPQALIESLQGKEAQSA